MRCHRLSILLVLCAGTLTLAAPSAAAAAGGHHREAHDHASAHKRESFQASTSVGIHVLPATANPGGPGSGPNGPGGAPSAGSGDGTSAGAHSGSDNGISAEVESGGEYDASSHFGSGDQSRGNPRFARPPRRARGALRGRAHGASHSRRHGAPHHGYLPFTGYSVMTIALSGTAAVLAGSALLWASVRRRKRAGRCPVPEVAAGPPG
ncbi:hypothetical protein GCM10027176_77310 [Actinoallomurus bryophytorum]|uniref:LPXTG-motif cell wall-anchored protein n=1 Tax=Actinoallomurus bryophytorum TaxID=1490222 RepID=A0A543C0W6_9ACTN|nr:hypothetical protein FB559_8042 [Actinoallomurus bryophytorum]